MGHLTLRKPESGKACVPNPHHNQLWGRVWSPYLIKLPKLVRLQQPVIRRRDGQRKNDIETRREKMKSKNMSEEKKMISRSMKR